MRRAAIATSVSVAAHALALAYLLRSRPPATSASTVAVAIVDAPPSDTPSSGPPTLSEPADRRPIPRARHPRIARVDPSPPTAPASAPPTSPAPIAPDGDQPTTDDDGPPEDSSAPAAATVTAPSPSPAPSRPRGESRPPGLDRATCIDHVDYPWKARLLDKEGMVRLRVVLGSDGRVQSATVVQGAGYGFDETAVAAIKTRCRFTPAYDAEGRAVPFVIENYHFYFRLEDFDPRAQMRRWQERW